MGACYLEVLIRTQSRTKFDKLYEDMWERERSYYGTDPYSGSWATIHNLYYRKDPFPNRKWTKKKYRDVSEWIENNCDKREALIIKSPKGYIVGGWAAE